MKASPGYLIPAMFLSLLIAQGCSPGSQTIEYGMHLPDTVPLLFAPNLVATNSDDYGGCFSPDGKSFLFCRSIENKEYIMEMHRSGKQWTPPYPSSVNSPYHDVYPSFSPSGSQLFFASLRPVNGKDMDWDIWVCKKTPNGWTRPVNAEPVNTAAPEHHPSVARNGNLYFNSIRKDGKGGSDIYVSRMVKGHYLPPENLGSNINTPYHEMYAYIDPDERFLIFCSNNKESRVGQLDLYLSIRRKEKWTRARNMGKRINTPYSERNPYVTPDGQYLLFTSDRPARKGPRNYDIYWVKFDF